MVKTCTHILNGDVSNMFFDQVGRGRVRWFFIRGFRVASKIQTAAVRAAEVAWPFCSVETEAEGLA